MKEWQNDRRICMIAAAVLCIMIFSGCSMSIGGSKPQKKPEVPKQEIQQNVKKEMKTPETVKIIEDAAKTQKLEELLGTPDASKVIQKELISALQTSAVNERLIQDLKKVLSTPDIQKQLQEHIKKALETPDVQKSLSDGVRKSVTQILQGGGQGGGQSGGAGGGGGSGGGGGGGGGQSGS